MFMHVIGGNELTALAFSERLKSFRPKQTVLEAEGHAARSKHLQGPSSQWVDVMKMKRDVHEQIINQVHKQRSNSDANHATNEEIEPEIISVKAKKKKGTSGLKRKAQSFRDEEFFISPVPTNQHLEAGLSVRGDQGFGSNRLESAVMDLVADDSSGIQKQKSVFHWDKKSKKYIKLNNGDRVTASGKVKTEGGKKVRAGKTGIYQKWKANTHSKIALKGTDHEGNGGESTSAAGGRFNRRFQGGRQQQQRSIPNAHVPSEIKNLDQVRKERQKKASRQSYDSYAKSKSNKGGKFGKSNDNGGKFGRSNDKGGKFGRSNNNGGKFGRSNDSGGKFGKSNNNGGKFGKSNSNGGKFGKNGKKRGRG